MFTKKLFLASFFLLSVVVVQKISAQTVAQSEGTQFPLTINGFTCNSKAECKVLCDDPVNKSACSQLAAQKNKLTELFSEPAFAQKASQALGCSTIESCKAVCSIAVNFEKCSTFAKENGLPGGKDEKVEVLKKQLASTSLLQNNSLGDAQAGQLKQVVSDLLSGSGQDIETYCDQVENQKICTVLAQRFGLNGGLKLEGPGGCQSAETCQAYCEDPNNFSECKEYELPGINGCTSELSCYSQVQSNPELLEKLKNRSFEKKSTEVVDRTQAINTQEVQSACDSMLDAYQGQPVSALTQDLAKSDACAPLPLSGVPNKNSNCDAYLSSNQPFKKEIFEKVCTFSVLQDEQNAVPQEVDVQTEQGKQAYQAWCEKLTFQGNAEDWKVIPEVCKQFVEKYAQTRAQCDQSTQESGASATDELTVSAYCLSAPENFADYASTCSSDESACQNGGYDWYCSQPGKSCQPLFQGTPVDKVVESFSQAGLLKESNQVALVLDESLNEVAKEIIQTPQLLSNFTVGSDQIHVLSQIPENVSQGAVFVGGSSAFKKANRSFYQNFSETIFSKNREASTTVQPSITSGSTPSLVFSQPWFSLTARTELLSLTGIPSNRSFQEGSAIQNVSATGVWGRVIKNEDKLKQLEAQYKIRMQNLQENNNTIFSTNRSLSPNEGSATISPEELERRRLEEERRRKQLLESGGAFPIPTTAPQSESSTGNTNQETGGSASGGESSSAPSPTRKLEPTKFPTLPPATPLPTRLPEPNPTATTVPTSGGSTGGSTGGTNSGGSSTTAGFIDGTAPPTPTRTPEVRGVMDDEEAVWYFLREWMLWLL